MVRSTWRGWATALTLVGAALVLGANFLQVQLALVGWATGLICFIAAVSCALVDARRQQQGTRP
ncbi:hypothetical protein NFX31_14330 [Microbacterium azadirachtae]|uniref:Uncharacterized protein n=1 Tax=Microbacterium azadirachtae TaxID=582680 RepID=A0A0F0L383_9MICO|nr:hypothetical protein [Microbacterium azadirachtae]KJL27159.1 hypothetical protein RL72_00627 [Microbacterium azadirachtae]UXW85370.1 hypothetical protein NFX31_14330 [Microbacterium azadirachtae]